MTKQLYVIAAVCLWLLSACQSSTYKYEAVYKDLPFDMPRVEAPKFPDRKVNLADFGAVGNGEELCTAAFAKAIDALAEKGGGHLIVPAGVWFTGPIVLKSNIDLQLETDAEKGDYLTVTGRFLACLLERRIIYPTITANGSYEDIVRKVLSRNVISAGIRNLPGFSMGTVSGDCWQKTAHMQVSYDNILEWLYSLCETIGGSANVRLDGNALKCDLFSGTDRSLLQDENPHIVFSDAYNNLLSFSYAADDAVQKNFAYVLGCGEGSARKRTTFCSSAEPTYLDRYEVYVDERNTAQEEDVTDAEYLEILKSSGAEHLVQPKTASESAIAAFSTQYQYSKDYFVGDYVTVEQRRFGLIQPRIQLIGMVESFDQNGRSLTPTFKETE